MKLGSFRSDALNICSLEPNVFQAAKRLLVLLFILVLMKIRGKYQQYKYYSMTSVAACHYG